MVKVQLYFTKHKHSFTVFIKNMEDLSVAQIQELEKFSKLRHGYFDFEKYSFTIQKNLDFREFTQVVYSLEIFSDLYETIPNSKQNQKVGFGKYKGMSYSELPDSYLLWLKNNYNGEARELIMQELKSRNL